MSSVQAAVTDGLATRGAFPWHVFLQNANNVAVKNGYAGGGVLINQYYVLTAAHKVTNVWDLVRTVLLKCINNLQML